jgi:catechol 2,3-dioxygenase-like lactoylglutathione lyase family enzyme
MSKLIDRRSRKAFLVSAEPQLFVSKLEASLEYYTQILGFSVAFSYGDPPFYGQVARDGAKLNLRSVDIPLLNPELIDREEYLSATITLEDASPLFLEYQAAGADFAQPLQREPWGAQTFIVRDPDGNLILFAGRLESDG